MIASGDTIQEEEHVEIAEDKDTPPRQAVDIKPTRKKKSQSRSKREFRLAGPGSNRI